jgi:hypothetical protein
MSGGKAFKIDKDFGLRTNPVQDSEKYYETQKWDRDNVSISDQLQK